MITSYVYVRWSVSDDQTTHPRIMIISASLAGACEYTTLIAQSVLLRHQCTYTTSLTVNAVLTVGALVALVTVARVRGAAILAPAV